MLKKDYGYINWCRPKQYKKEIFSRYIDKYDVTLDEMKQLIKQGAIVIDIRSPQEYSEGHINVAMLLPEYDILKKARKLLPDKNQLIIVYCGTGIRSKSAQRKLQKLGYTNVYNLYKGTENY